MPSRERPSDGLTPVPMLFLDDLKNVLKSVDTNVQKTHQEIVRIQEQSKNAEARIAKLEQQTDDIIANPHECKRKESIHDLQENTSNLSTRQSVIEKAIEHTNAEVEEVKTQKGRAIYWLLGVIVLVISGAIGWIVTLATLKTEVGYIKEQQADIKANLTIVQQRIINETTKTRQAIENQTISVAKELKARRPEPPLPIRESPSTRRAISAPSDPVSLPAVAPTD